MFMSNNLFGAKLLYDGCLVTDIIREKGGLLLFLYAKKQKPRKIKGL